jgi:hypothetical protein
MVTSAAQDAVTKSVMSANISVSMSHCTIGLWLSANICTGQMKEKRTPLRIISKSSNYIFNSLILYATGFTQLFHTPL